MIKAKKFFLITGIILLIAVVLRVYVSINFIDSATGNYTSSLWKWICVGVSLATIAISLLCSAKRFVAFSIGPEVNSNLAKSIFALCFISLAFVSIKSFTAYLTSDNIINVLEAVASLLFGLFFLYLILKGSLAKENTVYAFSLATFFYSLVRLLTIFNAYSKNIVLSSYRYEILGLSAFLLFCIFYIKSAFTKTSARKALVFSQLSFYFLTLFALPRFIFMILPIEIFHEGAGIQYIICDMAFAIVSLYLGSNINITNKMKH